MGTIFLLGFSVVLTLSTSDATQAAKTSPVQICEQHISDVSETEGVPLGLLYAIALTETGIGGLLSPYALNIEGVPIVHDAKEEAMAAFSTARKRDTKMIDIGCMQINYFYHHAGFASDEAMFDPKQNITYAAKFLKSLKRQSGSWTVAVARYHAGAKNKVAQHRYVCKVLHNLVATRFGRLTPQAEALCTAKGN
jgi:Transglycosylase SLT domain